MNHAPFPHLLKVTKTAPGKAELSIVSDSAPIPNLAFRVGYTPKTNEPVYAIITDIKESRPAEGNWNNWSSHPSQYTVNASIEVRVNPKK